jgi:hypothetical protein
VTELDPHALRPMIAAAALRAATTRESVGMFIGFSLR